MPTSVVKEVCVVNDAATAPEIFGDNEEGFRRTYWYNSLFKELFISYADVKYIKYSGKIRLKDGTKYVMWGKNERWGEIQRAVQSKLTP